MSRVIFSLQMATSEVFCGKIVETRKVHFSCVEDVVYFFMGQKVRQKFAREKTY